MSDSTNDIQSVSVWVREDGLVMLEIVDVDGKRSFVSEKVYVPADDIIHLLSGGLLRVLSSRDGRTTDSGKAKMLNDLTRALVRCTRGYDVQLTGLMYQVASAFQRLDDTRQEGES